MGVGPWEATWGEMMPACTPCLLLMNRAEAMEKLVITKCSLTEALY